VHSESVEEHFSAAGSTLDLAGHDGGESVELHARESSELQSAGDGDAADDPMAAPREQQPGPKRSRGRGNRGSGSSSRATTR
jgi:hypothetical protein